MVSGGDLYGDFIVRSHVEFHRLDGVWRFARLVMGQGPLEFLFYEKILETRLVKTCFFGTGATTHAAELTKASSDLRFLGFGLTNFFLCAQRFFTILDGDILGFEGRPRSQRVCTCIFVRRAAYNKICTGY